MRLIFVRHGETEENKKRIMQGHLPGTLSAKGIQQAKKVAQRLAAESIDVIYSSDLARAANTADEINVFHNVPIHYVRFLREKFWGTWQGKKEEEVVKSTSSNEETDAHLKQRAQQAIHFLHEQKKQCVLYVSHSDFGTVFLEELCGEKLESLTNTSVSIFEIDGVTVTTQELNCAKHLS